jgi:hypothetical protein
VAKDEIIPPLRVGFLLETADQFQSRIAVRKSGINCGDHCIR